MPRRTAFTLVELLIVLAVLGLLAALLLPVLGRAREGGRRTHCLSNVRQLSLGVLQYTVDHGDILPPVAYEAEGATHTWPQLVAPYIRSAGVFRCPSDRHSAEISYGLNGAAFLDLSEPQSGRSLIYFQRAAETLMLGETGTGSPADPRDLTTPRPDSLKLVAPHPAGAVQLPRDGRPAARHHGSCVLSFLDGHARALPLERFYLGQTPVTRFFAPES